MFVHFVKILYLKKKIDRNEKKGMQAFDCHIDKFCVFRQNKEVEFV